MKILIANDGMHAHFHERLSWVNAFNSIPGVQCYMYDVINSVAFDVFDDFEPDIYIGQLYNMKSDTFKCLLERPHIKVALRAGEFIDPPPRPKQILSVQPAELMALREYLSRGGNLNFIYSHYLQKDIEETHENFLREGISVLGVPMSADVHTYCNAKYMKELECDIAFVGGYWPYKGYVIDKYLTPLCQNFNYNIKIFGNQPWPHVNQYCGILKDEYVANLFKSAKICPNLSEPHSHLYGIDVNERAFKVLAAGGFCIMDSVRAARDMLDGVVFAESPEAFRRLVDYYLSPKRDAERANIANIGRNHVLRNHTNYHRIISMLTAFKEDVLADTAKGVRNAHINNIL